MAADTLSFEGERRLHAVYNSMKDRCYNPKSVSYRYYGARGISMCDTWLNNYEEFRDWAVESGYVEDAPRGACTIDRIDSNGNYEPNNCRWVDMKVQNSNRRRRRHDRRRNDSNKPSNANNTITENVRDSIYSFVEENGMTVSELSRRIGISRSSLYEKMDGKSPWLLNEIIALASVMGCEEKDIWTARSDTSS